MHAVLLLFRPLPNIAIRNIGIWGMYNLAKAYRSIPKSIPIRRVEDWEASNGHTQDTTPRFHGPWRNPVDERICAQPFRMWDRLRFHRSHKYCRDARTMQITRILKISLPHTQTDGRTDTQRDRLLEINHVKCKRGNNMNLIHYRQSYN